MRKPDYLEFKLPTKTVAKPRPIDRSPSWQPPQIIIDEHVTLFDNRQDADTLALRLLDPEPPPQGALHLRVFDPDFSVFSSRRLAEQLKDFLLRSRARRLTAVLMEDQTMRRDFIWLMDTLKTFDHAVDIYVLKRNRDRMEDAYIVADRQTLLLRPQRKRWQGRLYWQDPKVAIPFDDRFDELIESSEPVGLNTLGL